MGDSRKLLCDIFNMDYPDIVHVEAPLNPGHSLGEALEASESFTVERCLAEGVDATILRGPKGLLIVRKSDAMKFYGEGE